MSLGPGDALGPFRILERVGEGGMARVYKVQKGRRGVIRAAKVLREDLADRPEVVQRFLREARILSGLDHPRIVRVTEIGPETNPAWFAMDFVEGQSLSEALEPGTPLGDEAALRILGDVLAALDHAHAEGIVHRDLKPANVLLDHEGRAKLTDFGIAKLLEGTQLTETGARLGTPHYMAPEQVRGRRSVGVGADIYSAGVLAYELLTGKRPFDGQDPVAIGYCHAYEPAPEMKRRGKKVPEELQAWVSKAMEKKVSARWRNAGSMRRGLVKVAKGMEISLPRLPRKKRKKATQGRAKKRSSPATSNPGAVPMALPGPRHLGGDGGTRRLVGALGLMVAGSVALGLTPGTRPGFEARSPAAAQAGQRHFLEGLGAAGTGRWQAAIPAWKRAARADPALLPAVRDHAIQALDDALARGERRGAEAYLALARWADPGWVGGLDYAQRLRRRWPD